MPMSILGRHFTQMRNIDITEFSTQACWRFLDFASLGQRAAMRAYLVWLILRLENHRMLLRMRHNSRRQYRISSWLTLIASFIALGFMMQVSRALTRRFHEVAFFSLASPLYVVLTAAIQRPGLPADRYCHYDAFSTASGRLAQYFTLPRRTSASVNTTPRIPRSDDMTAL